MRLLVVEDDPDLNRQLVTALTDAGYAVDSASDGEEGHYLGDTEPYDAVILDLGLPVMDGVSILEAWRREDRKMPVLILTARDRWSDKVAEFDAGADDYVSKPFHMEEVLARVRALLRRSAGHASSEIGCGPLRLDTKAARVSVDGQAVKLTSLEFRLLAYLMHHKGRVVSRTELVEHLYDQDFDRDSNTIEVFIGRLRKKLGVDVLRTIRGLGYVSPSRMMRPSSLAFRLTVSAAIVSLVLLVSAGLLLSYLFQVTIERNFDARLQAVLDGLLANVEVNEDGAPVILGAIADTRFKLPLSGWYWQVSATDGRPDHELVSESLLENRLRPGQLASMARNEWVSPASISSTRAAISCAGSSSTSRCSAASSNSPSWWLAISTS